MYSQVNVDGANTDTSTSNVDSFSCLANERTAEMLDVVPCRRGHRTAVRTRTTDGKGRKQKVVDEALE